MKKLIKKKFTNKYQLGGVMNWLENFYWHTLKAPKNYTEEKAILRKNKTKKNPPVCVDCAKWANDQLQGQGYSVFGDAWTRSSNKVRKIYSGYDTKNKPKKYTEEAYDQYINAASDSIQKVLDPDVLKSSNKYIVGLQFKNSPNKRVAFLKGTNGEVQTHTGNIVIEDEVPYVVHNVHGEVQKNKLKDLMGSNKPVSVVSIYQVLKKNGGTL